MEAYYKQYKVPAYVMYEVNKMGNIELTPENFQIILKPSAPPATIGAFDANKIEPNWHPRLIDMGFIPVYGDVHACFVPLPK